MRNLKEKMYLRVPSTGWESHNIAPPGTGKILMSPGRASVFVQMGESAGQEYQIRVDLIDYVDRRGVQIEGAFLESIAPDGCGEIVDEVDTGKICLV